MKNIFILFALMVAIYSCSNNSDLDVKRGTKFIAGLGIDSNPISIEEADTKSSSTATTLVSGTYLGIQITKVVESGTNEVVAAGLFKGDFDFSSLRVEMEHGQKYIIEATAVVSGQKFDVGNDLNPDIPFNDQPITSDWINDKATFLDLSAVDLNINGVAEGERWYFVNEEFEADYTNPDIPINLRRVSFKVKYIIKNLDNDLAAKLSFYKEGVTPDTGLNKVVVDGYEQIYTLYPVKDAFADLVNYSNRYDFNLMVFQDAKELKRDEYSFQPSANKVYQATWDATTIRENSIDISFEDVWPSGDPVIIGEKIVVM